MSNIKSDFIVSDITIEEFLNIINSNDTIEVYTDGSCKGNPGAGGWGAILIFKNKRVILSGNEAITTNNRMELTAAIKALEVLPRDVCIIVYTDSSYVKNGITAWLQTWKENNWLTKDNKPVKNVDLWNKLDNVTQDRNIIWNWVKGHSDCVNNNNADFVARSAINDEISNKNIVNSSDKNSQQGKSLFITLEGGEGCGKSTQARLLYEALKKEGYDVILTREPGGTELAEMLRDIVVKGSKKLDVCTEMLIFMTARSDHWHNCIKPALAGKKIVICDRFHDSTLVYQCICGGCSTQLVNDIYGKITGDIQPDKTFVIDIDPMIGLYRSVKRKNNTDLRFENRALPFHEAVRTGYLLLAEKSERYYVLDGTLPVEQIHEKIMHEILPIVND